MDSRAILTQLTQRFPAPKPNPVWVDNIIASLRSANLPITIDSIVEQYLYADLSHSTLPSSLLPTDPEVHQVKLLPSPSLLQICSITEIGSSAFQLQTVAEQRKDVFEGASRIKRMDDEEPEDDEAADDKAPSYPRGMLKLEVTDGERVMQAMEYRRIPDLVLGETGLGAKNVKALRNMLLLEPANTQVLGSSVEALDQDQSRQFTNGLLARLGKPIPDDAEQARRAVRAPSAPLPPPRSAITNGPITTSRALKPTASGASARAAALAAALNPPPKPVESPYFQQNATAGPSRSTAVVTPARPARGARTQAERSIKKLYDNYPAFEPRSVPPSRTSNPRVSEVTDTFSDFDSFDDSFLHQVDEVAAQASAPPRGQSSGASLSTPADDDDFGDVDESFFRHVEDPHPPSKKQFKVNGNTKKRRAVVSDESDDEKENRPRHGRKVEKSSSWGDQRDVIELSSD